MRLAARTTVAVLLAVAAAACAEIDRRPAAPVPPAQTVSSGGLALTAVGGTWSGFPPDLDRYYVPIEVVVSNDRSEPVEFRLADFTLVDGSGQARPAIPPEEATTMLFGTYGRRSGAGDPSPGGTGERIGATAGGAAVAPARSFFFFSGRFTFPLGYYRPYYYPYYPPYPYAYDPYRAGGYRSYADLTGDLVRFGLSGGTIEPNASIDGFLFFPHGEGEPADSRLRWSAPGLAEPLVAPIADLER